MNANLLNAIRKLAASQGAGVFDSRRADGEIPVFAGREAANERKVFIQCLASGLPAELQNCPDRRSRLDCKNRCIRQLSGQGFAAPLAQEIADLVDSLIPAAASTPPAPPPVYTPPPQLQTPPPNYAPPQPPPQSYQGYPQQTVPVSSGKDRHGFTSFWLILCLIGNALGAAFLLLGSNMLSSLYDQETLLYMGIAALVSTIAVIMILCWKKTGFWILFGAHIVSSFLTYDNGSSSIGQIAFGFISIAIVYGVLHLRRNNKTTWEQME
jgi:hypothetical protein